MLYVVIDVGCHECGVDSEVVGCFRTRQEADRVRDETSERTKDWRDGGRSIPMVFEIVEPNADAPVSPEAALMAEQDARAEETR